MSAAVEKKLPGTGIPPRGVVLHRHDRDCGDSHAQALRRVGRRAGRSAFGRLRADHLNADATGEDIESLPTPDGSNPVQSGAPGTVGSLPAGAAAAADKTTAATGS